MADRGTAEQRLQVVRLIPVSAVGDGFVRLDQSGNNVKVADRTPHPTNLEVPLSAVLPDLLRKPRLRSQRLGSPAHIGGAAESAPQRSRRRSHSSSACLPGWFCRPRYMSGSAGMYSDAIAATFVDWMCRPAQDGEASEQNRSLVPPAAHGRSQGV